VEDDDTDVDNEISSASFSEVSHPPTHATCCSGMYSGTEPRRKLNCNLWTGPGPHYTATAHDASLYAVMLQQHVANLHCG